MTALQTPPGKLHESRFQPGKWAGNIAAFWRILRGRMADDRITQRAAALTYNTLFSLLPTLVLALVIMSLVLSGKQIQQEETQLISRLGLNQMQTRGASSTQPSLFVNTIINQIQTMRSVLKSPTTGIVGFITLLWGAISLMLVIEAAFNDIYRVTTKRPWVRKFVLYWSVLSLGPLAAVFSLFLSAKLFSAAESLRAASVVFTPVSILVSYAGDWVLFLVFYKLIPNTNVKFRAAATGALAATLMWEVGKYGFGLYVKDLAGYGKWYGNLGLIPLFMFWIYITWNFVLMGLEVAFITQYFGILRRRYVLGRGFHTPLIDARWVLPLGVLLVQHFKKGEKISADKAAAELGIPLEATTHLLGAMAKVGLVHTLDGLPPQFVLAKAPEDISVEDLLKAASERCQLVSDSAHAASTNDPFLRTAKLIEMHTTENDWHKRHTLASLAAGE